MADRTVNININYNINTDALAKVQAQSAQAQKATDLLGGAANKASTDSSNAYKKLSTTLEGLTLKLAQLKGHMSLTRLDDPKLPGLSKQYKELKAQIDSVNKALFENKKASQEAGKGAQDLAKQLGQLYSAAKLYISAGIVKELVNTTLEMSALAGKTQGVEKAFMRAFPDGVLVLNDLRKATKGTITDFELMQRTLQATNLGVAVEKLPVLFQFAAARAQQTGESVDYLVDSIVRGIGRKSLLILDNLGLSAVRLKEQFNGASLASQSVADVTKAVGNIAQEELTKMGGFAENAATKVDQLSVSWEGLKLQLARFFQDGAVVSYFDGLVKKASDFFEIVRRGISAQDLYHERVVQEAAITAVNIIKQNEYNAANDIYLKNIREVIAEKTHELILQQEEIKNNDKVRASLLRAAKGYEEVKKISEDNFKEQKARKTNNELLIEEIKLLNGVAKSLELKAANDSVTDPVLDNLETLEKKIKDLNEELEKTAPIQTKAGVEQARVLKDQINETQILIDTIKDQIYWEELLQKRRQDQKQGGTKLVNPTGNQLANTTPVSTDSIPAMVLPAPIIPEDEWDKLEKSFKSHLEDIYSAGSNIAMDQVASLLQAEVTSMDIRLEKTKNYYDEQIKLAGNNDRAKAQLEQQRDKQIAKLERERNERAKKAALSTILINTAIGVVKAFATSATIYDGIVQAAIVAAEGASQYAIANRAKYKDGVIDVKGPGTGTSDSIPAMISRGESVMTAKETFKAKGVLEMIRANKLDDNVLKSLQLSSQGVKVVGMDDKRIVNAIEKNKAPDLIRNFNDMYYVTTDKQGNKKKIRAKAMGNG